jgi:single-stranded DNA-specific DHH superfamily exonuclease
MKYWDKLEKWVANATIADIVCHTDSDGLTAAAQLIRFLKEKGVGYNVILGSPQRIKYANFWRKIRNGLVFFLDIPADHESEELKKLNNRANIVIIDHHKIEQDMNSDSIIHYHREFMEEKRYYPSSKQVYDLFGGIDWMACIGLIGDYGGKPWKAFINKVHKEYGFPECEDENCFDSPFTKYDQLISSARIYSSDKGCLKALNILVNSKDFEDFKEKASILEEWAKQVNDYIEFLKGDYDHNKDFHKEAELIFYEIPNPKFNIGSALSTIVSTQEPNKTVIIIVNKGSSININIRRQDGRHDMSALAKKCGGGGGHARAAGASIKVNKLEEFKQCVIETLIEWGKNEV